MAYKYGNREQITFLPNSVEQYVSESDPVRAYDAFIDALGASSLGLDINPDKVGNSTYDPVTMLKILIYGYSYGWQSSRKLERALHHNLSFIWLAGGLKPDHKTIANFRRNNKEVLKKVLKQCVRMCMKLNLIEGNVLFTDGTKLRANAGRNQTKSKIKLQKILEEIDQRIEALLEECHNIDSQEEGHLVKMQKELKDKKRLHRKISKLIDEMEDEASVNTTDPESKIMKSRQGSHSAYNGQVTTDDLHGLIVSAEATSDTTDYRQLPGQLRRAEENTGKACKVICADSGYSSVDLLKSLVESERAVIVPSNQQAKNDAAPSGFEKEHFIYDPDSDTYTCPEGKELYRSYQAQGSNKVVYRMTNYKNCLTCKNYGACTSAKKGRTLNRLINEDIQDELIRTYESDTGQQIYQRRKAKVELPFGHIKHNLGINSFLVRGLNGADSELKIMASCFNIARMITLLGGVQIMVELLRQMKG